MVFCKRWISKYSFVLLVGFISAYSQAQTGKVASGSYHHPTDDSTLLTTNGFNILPYNRYVDPAGTTVCFGSDNLENHSLDAVILPDGKTLAVEDRFGMTLIDIATKKVTNRLEFEKDKATKGYKSTFSGIKAATINNVVHIFWSVVDNDTRKSLVLDAQWDGKKTTIAQSFDCAAKDSTPLALPNEIALQKVGDELYLLVVLNGNNQLVKVRYSDKKTMWTSSTGMAPYGVALANGKAYVTNWAGTVPNDTKETAGVPKQFGDVYINPSTGGTLQGTVSIIDIETGKKEKEIEVGLHPNAIIASHDHKFIYVANGNSDYVSVINTSNYKVVDTISVGLDGVKNPFIGHSPNALAIDSMGTRLYVANGMDNAVAVIDLGANVSSKGKGKTKILGFIPTEAYPGGLALDKLNLYVCNLEAIGARYSDDRHFYTAHHQGASVSIILLPKEKDLPALTERVEKANLLFRAQLTQLLPRKGIAPQPVPERIGEPSPIKHILYIIKENRTYDQVFGDIKEGNGMASLCIYGDSITPNEHKLVHEFLLMDNFHVSGKSSAEGHQWTDAAMTSDYVEKNVRAWFRSYPHVQTDALVYNKSGFIWNNALDHGKTVRIYGEACDPQWDRKYSFRDIYAAYKKDSALPFTNTTTISRVRPILSQTCPCADTHDFPDVMRADAFIKELKNYEKQDGDQWPELMVMALSDDHTAGTRPGVPTPRAMVADNDMAVGKIIDAISHSKFWASTAIFITEDDSQDGWDHVSAYRTTGLVVSPYSKLNKTVHTNYNQTSMVRTMEQILGIPPMNVIDATALPMFDCFAGKLDTIPYQVRNNLIPLDEMNKNVGQLNGKALHYAVESSKPEFDKLDGGDDDLLNHILWFAAKGNQPYPKRMTLPKKDNDRD